MADVVLAVVPLTAAAFAPFGDVIAAPRDDGTAGMPMNAGSARRFADLARIDAGDGAATIGIVRAQPRPLPFAITMLERHPLGTQAFVPLAGARWIVVVATSPEAMPLAFLAARGEGVSYHRGTWHHPLIALDDGGDFLVVDRIGAGANCDEVSLATRYVLTAESIAALRPDVEVTGSRPTPG